MKLKVDITIEAMATVSVGLPHRTYKFSEIFEIKLPQPEPDYLSKRAWGLVKKETQIDFALRKFNVQLEAFVIFAHKDAVINDLTHSVMTETVIEEVDKETNTEAEQVNAIAPIL